jgi:hypothetical protein
MQEDLRLRNYAPNAQRAYFWHVAMFAKHFGECPAELNCETIREYLVYLHEIERWSRSRMKQAFAASRFVL